jgi:hypothetical protein
MATPRGLVAGSPPLQKTQRAEWGLSISSDPNCRAVILAADLKLAAKIAALQLLEEKNRARGDSNLKPSDP